VAGCPRPGAGSMVRRRGRSSRRRHRRTVPVLTRLGWQRDTWFRLGPRDPLRRFNSMPDSDAAALLRTCLPVDRWVHTVLDARPFRNPDELLEVARGAASPFTPAELEAAVAGYHNPALMPRLRRGHLSSADAFVRRQIESGIDTYESRFGRPFVVSTDARLPTEILVQLWDRLGHDIETEDREVAQQLREIALLELTKTIGYKQRG
jgi:2-oxo-4-hydroxy-4-carboxy-5-ureidoimidazoline decarboxylase